MDDDEFERAGFRVYSAHQAPIDDRGSILDNMSMVDLCGSRDSPVAREIEGSSSLGRSGEYRRNGQYVDCRNAVPPQESLVPHHRG